MRSRFGINTVFFFIIILITVVSWIGFELFHQKVDSKINPNLINEANTKIPSSLDSETLKTLYSSKDKFYDHTKEK